MLPHLPFPARLLISSIALASAGAAVADEPTTLGTVTVVGDAADSYRAPTASVAGSDDAPLLDTPASVSVFNAQLLQDQQARLLSEVLRNDASVGESYAPVGYYENFVVRGFSLNAANSYKINGRTIAGEQNVALENKEQVEVLKGLAGLQSGVSDPGGVVNYVTKRPRDIRSVTVTADQDSGRSLAVDVGGFFGAEQQFGLRANVAHEDIRSYVDHADGQRDFASLAFDWVIDPRATLQLDVEYQAREQRSVPGYQLLGGSELPHGVNPHDLLGYQSWSKPVRMDSLNTSGRYTYLLTDDWTARLGLSHSQVVIDDYSAFPWGCYGAASCASTAVPNTFSSEGDYDIYDFRSPNDTRRVDEAEAALSGRFDLAGLRHELDLGLSAQRRTVDSHDEINEWVGSGNINAAPADYTPYSGSLTPSYRHLDSRQYGLFVNDRVHLSERWQLLLGGREVLLDEKTFDSDGDTTRHTRQWKFLPNLALVYQPWDNTSLYARYSKGLALGREADWYTTNAGDTLAPTISRQVEVGIKQDWQRVSLGAALFQMHQGYQYSKDNGDGTLTFVQQGEQKNTGLELTASGRASERLQLSASVAAIRAEVSGSGTDAYDGHQAINVPKLRASLYGDYSVPGVDGLALLGGVQYSASKYANRAGTVKVGDYAVFNAGSRYTTRIDGYETVLRLSVDNLFNKAYWRDVGEYMGDGYLFPGAPRTARLSATVNF
ncbi:TonB-dependent siderophore receptor [Pseudomonas sp. RIT-PI-S]|uniref:TonB-dependent siderophore receptor n=1 Tax=Pseudomonas sp. RIT-PI-S TaxID=3035295 RepID=UPI0021D84B6B|nr:TonB-dependent siderophore receptor [Pseudomonas sp. RIT-PI-S]